MGIKLAFLSGARSDYAPCKNLLQSLDSDSRFDLNVIPNGMHLLEEYGYTVQEIRKDGFKIPIEIKTYAKSDSKVLAFTHTVHKVYEALLPMGLEAVIVVGDRIEAYGSALAAHFAGIPVIHSGGGHITLGAIDNIYRYNISNLASLHLVTSKTAYKRLIKIPTISNERVFYVGSPAIDAINIFKDSPVRITSFVPNIHPNKFALMTFHSVTAKVEPISELMQTSINYILDQHFDILVTFPNNDGNSHDIINVIKNNKSRNGVYAIPHLGVEGYYAALNDCSFVIGNSSSGIMEAPYFNKPVLNIGTRQDGRDKDDGIFDFPATHDALLAALTEGFTQNWPPVSCRQLYGNGNSVSLAQKAIYSFLTMNKCTS